jgi:hypothetical protein
VNLLQRHLIKDAISFKSIIRANLLYYQDLRKTRVDYNQLEEESLKYFRAFQEMYPQAMLPKIYFVVGQLNSQLTIVNDTVIVCIENFRMFPWSHQQAIIPPAY